MTVTLTNGTDTIVPVQVLGYDAEAEHGNIVHRPLGTDDVDVVLRPAGPRSGTFELVMPDEATAAAAELALRGAHGWAYARDDMPTTDMQLIVRGRVRRWQDRATARWLVSLGWHEVPA